MSSIDSCSCISLCLYKLLLQNIWHISNCNLVTCCSLNKAFAHEHTSLGPSISHTDNLTRSIHRSSFSPLCWRLKISQESRLWFSPLGKSQVGFLRDALHHRLHLLVVELTDDIKDYHLLSGPKQWIFGG